ncbi:MAG TPA: nuclear transport factor 2 family protein [Thermoleophilaceae bacterium]|nr:nuclear transport factor 2 family protein [Thermoleophilaceae bacterium]
MPWAPELFSAPALERIQEKWQQELVTVPFFDGLLTDEVDALVGSFDGEPELYDPVRGRVRGTRAFEAFVAETKEWLSRNNASIEDVERVVEDRYGFAEVVLHLDDAVDLPVAIVNDRRPDGRIGELRMYYSTWPLIGRHTNRSPLLQPDPDLREADVVGEYQQALAAGDVDAIVAAFEPDGYAREPAGGAYVHKGAGALRDFYELLFSNGGGIPLEHCTVIDNGRACALEYNVVRWGETELPPQAGVAVYERGQSGRLAAARVYDDVDPPLGSRT